MKRLRAKPYWRQRLWKRIGEGLRPYRFALAGWFAWAIAALILHSLLGEQGQFYALILFGGIVLVGLAYVAHWLRKSILRDRNWESGVQQAQDFAVRELVSPRRPLPAWEHYMASAELLECLWRLIHEERPNRVLELGSGLSTLVMAYAMEAAGAGSICSLEDHAGYAARTRRLLREHNLETYAEVIATRFEPLTIASDAPYWYDISVVDLDAPIDLLFVDGPSRHFHPKIRYPALPVLREFLADDAFIVVDDASKVEEAETIRQWLAQFPDLRVEPNFPSSRFTVLRLAGANVCSASDERAGASEKLQSA